MIPNRASASERDRRPVVRLGGVSTSMKPLIGMTPSPSLDEMAHGTFLRFAMSSPYVEAVSAAGGVPIVLPPQEDHAGPLLAAIDGLLLSGGGDIEPWRFGEPEVHPATYGLSPERDQFEL